MQSTSFHPMKASGNLFVPYSWNPHWLKPTLLKTTIKIHDPQRYVPRFKHSTKFDLVCARYAH